MSKSTADSLELCEMIKEMWSEYADSLFLGCRKGQCDCGPGTKVCRMKDSVYLYQTARMNLEGEMIPKDIVKGHQLLVSAASLGPSMSALMGLGLTAHDLGVMSACYDLGLAYETGKDVKFDPRQALEWYQKAVVLGCGDSLNKIGSIYYNSNEVHKALDYWRLSALLGTAAAIEKIAAYFHDFGDLELSMRWFQLAHAKRSMDPYQRKSLLLRQPFMKMEDHEDLINMLEKDVRASSLGPLLLKFEALSRLKKAPV